MLRKELQGLYAEYQKWCEDEGKNVRFEDEDMQAFFYWIVTGK